MPATIVHLVGEDDILVEQDYDTVRAQLETSESGEFNRRFGSEIPRIVIYRSAIAYIQEAAPSN